MPFLNYFFLSNIFLIFVFLPEYHAAEPKQRWAVIGGDRAQKECARGRVGAKDLPTVPSSRVARRARSGCHELFRLNFRWGLRQAHTRRQSDEPRRGDDCDGPPALHERTLTRLIPRTPAACCALHYPDPRVRAARSPRVPKPLEN